MAESATDSTDGQTSGPVSRTFTPVPAFTRLLTEFSVEQHDLAPGDGWLFYLLHNECQERVCEIEDGDDMAVLVLTVIKHACPGEED